MTSAGVGPFSSIIEAITVEGGKLVEQNGGFFSSIGFIVLIVIVVLVILTCLAILVLVAKHKYKNNAGTYHGKYIDLCIQCIDDSTLSPPQFNKFII